MGKIRIIRGISRLHLAHVSLFYALVWKFLFTLSVLRGAFFAPVRVLAFKWLEKFGDVVVGSDGLVFEVNGIDDSAAKVLPTYEAEQRTWIPSAAEGSIFLDIGANIGLYSLNAWQKGYQVFAFEIGEKAIRRFRRNCELNQTDRIELRTVALGAAEQELVFYEQDIHTGGSGFSRPDPKLAVRERKVQMQPLDSQNIHWGSVRYVKIDVEGYELEVFKGASKLLMNSAPGTLIQVEVLDDPTRVSSSLAPFGFSIVRQLHNDYLFEKRN
jgi:FkbM family methyltransferase